MEPKVHTALSSEPLSLDAAYRFVSVPAAGAVVTFTGTVREHTDGRAVHGLTYEAFREHAEPQLAELARELTRKWPEVVGVWMAHRVGELAVGEPSVLVAVAAPHRPEAFDAARWGIDTLKATVAIWKQEHWADGGAHWPGSPGGDRPPGG